MAETDRLQPPVWVVGMGAEGPQSLSHEARARVAEAELLVGGARHLAFFPAHPAERLVIGDRLPDVAAAIARHTGRVTVLASGDPNFFGVAGYLRRALGASRVRVLPNLSSVQLAFARIGESWQDAVFLSVHGRPLASIVARTLTARKVAILTDPQHTPARVAEALWQAGLEDCAAYVCEQLGTEREHVFRGTLRQLLRYDADPLNLVVLVREPATGGTPRAFGVSEQHYMHTRGLITKAEVRAVSLAQLNLRPFGVCWDVGAGSGSLAIEAAKLAPEASVFAVERDQEQLRLLEANRSAHHVHHLQIVAGEAPEALRDLPAPHSVFLGGSGGRLRELLPFCLERLHRGGTLVANFATLEHLSEAQQVLANCGQTAQVTQVSVARGTGVAGLTRLAALNPVFIMQTQKG